MADRQHWLWVRGYLRRHRYELGQAVVQEYPEVPRVDGTVLLTRPEWLPTEPVPLDAVELLFTPGAPDRGLTSTDSVVRSVCPERADGSTYPSYSAAMADLAAPAIFSNRPTYRLLDAELAGHRSPMVFGRGRYFDGIDLGEAAAHEYALAQTTGGPTPLRASIGDPGDLARRPANVGIAALTVRHDRAQGAASFLLHWRDPTKVGHAGGLSMVVPVGIFQPCGEEPSHEQNDFSLWRCLVREYAEELRGASEDHAPGPVDYDRWPFATRMTEARRDGLVTAHVLGLGVDPLTFATDLLVLVVFDAALFDDLFAGMTDQNAEGRLLGATPADECPCPGFPCTADELRRMARHPLMQPAGAAALTLARRTSGLLLP